MKKAQNFRLQKLVQSPFDFQQEPGEPVTVTLTSLVDAIVRRNGNLKPAKPKSRVFGVHIGGPDDIEVQVSGLNFQEAKALFDAVPSPLTDETLELFREGKVPGAFNNGWPYRFRKAKEKP